MTWAASIHDPEQRRRVVVNLGRAWLRRDAPAAEGWLAEADLPADLVRAIRQPSPTAEVEPACNGDAECGE
jgi:hypothetical protein